MKKFCNLGKRFLSMVLAVVMLVSYANLGIFSHVHAVEAGEKATLGVLIKENVDGLTNDEIAIITSGNLSADKSYPYQMPGDADDLISVNEETGTVTAKVYTDPAYGTVWTPKSFALTDGDSVISGYGNLALTEQGGVYVGTYDYTGKAFSVVVTYSLDLVLSEEDLTAQQEMLDAPYGLAQDIATLKYLNAVGVIDDEKVGQQIVDLSGGLISDYTKIHADTILEFLAMNLAQLDGQSAIDWIYQLVKGIDYEWPKVIDYENGKVTMATETLMLYADGSNAAKSLYNQKKANGWLDLTVLLNKTGDASYLELLVKHNAELKSAVMGNFADIDYLANGELGLGDINTEITKLILKARAIEEEAFGFLNAKLPPDVEGVPIEDIHTLEELQAFIAQMEALDQRIFDEANEDMGELTDEVKEQLAEFGITLPEKVTNEEELLQLEGAMIKAYNMILGKINTALSELDDATMAKLKAYGAPEQITVSDTTNYDTFIATGDQDEQDMLALDNALTKVYADALKTANDELTAIYNKNETLKLALQNAGAPAKIESSEDVKALRTALATAKGTLLSQANTLLQGLDSAVKAQLVGAPESITTTQDLLQLQTAVDNAKAKLLKAADDVLQNLDSAVKAQLVGAPESITTTQDLLDLQTAVANAKAKILQTANTQLENMDPALKAQLTGAPAKIESGADLTALKTALQNAYNKILTKANSELQTAKANPMAGAFLTVDKIESKADIEQLIEDIDKTPAFVQTALLATRSGLVDAVETLTALEGAVAGVEQAETAVLKIEAVEGDLNTAAAAVTKLDEVKGNLDAAAAIVTEMDAADAKLAEAYDGMVTLEETIAQLKTAEEAIHELHPHLADALHVQQAMELLNNVYLPLAREAEKNIIKMEDGIAMMQEKQTQLNMLIMVMQTLSKALKPVNDAFVNDTWTAPKVLDAATNPNYKNLTDLADGLENKNHTAVSTLHVTETDVRYSVAMYDVTVQYQAVVNTTKPDSTDTVALATKTYTLTLTKGATAQEILAKIAEEIDENAILTGWAISADNYDRSATALPEALTENITYTVSYAPKMLTVSFGEGYEAGTKDIQVPYGYRMTLPKIDDVTREYIYTVGDESNIDQGTVVTILKDTAISREEGAISEKQYLTDLVINTTEDMEVLVKNILSNNALNKGDAISIRVPGKDQVVVVVAPDASSVTITALPYGSRVGDKNWIANTANLDGTVVTLVDGVYTETENIAFDEVTVNYQLAITAAALGITDAQLLAVMNTPYELVGDYKYQQSKLNALGSPEMMQLMSMLNDTVDRTYGGFSMTLKEALNKVEDLDDFIDDVELSDSAKEAAKALSRLIKEDGFVNLYDTMLIYNEQGMIHYYKNEATYISQITELNNILKTLISDPGIVSLIAEYADTMAKIQATLDDAASLAEPEHKVNRDLINVDSPYLNTLLNALEAAKETELTYYATAPGELIWTAAVTQPGPSKCTATMTVDFGGARVTASKNVAIGETLTYAELTAWAKELAAELGLTDETAVYYNVSYSFSGDMTVGQDVTFTASWNLRDFDVKVEGEKVGTVNYDYRQITLPQNSDPNYRYKYYINGQLYGAGTHTLTLAQFKLLVEGKLNITRESVNLTEEALVKLIDNMGGAAVLTKDANGEYAIVLPVNPTTVQGDMTNFVIGLFMTEYKYIAMGEKTFFDGKFHLQALVDVIMNSGIGTDSMLKLIDANGNITSNLTLAEGTEVLNTVKPANLNNLGGVLIETSMGFGTEANALTNAKFYITLAGTVDEMATVRKGLEKAKSLGVSFVLNNDSANLSVNLPDQVYAAYLAALSIVGQTDVYDLSSVNAQTAIGYILGLVDPVISDDVTYNTIVNTLNKAGIERDISEYKKYFDVAFDLLNRYIDLDEVAYTQDSASLALENVSINKVVDKLQGYVNNMDLPAGLSVDLTKLIYEYDDQSTAQDNVTAGLEVAASLKIENLGTEYAALFADVRAEGILNKFGMWTEAELLSNASNLAGISVIVLTDDVTGNLNFNTKTILDLNGKTVNGNITGGANANVIIIDNAYDAVVPGTVNGTVSGNVTPVAGKYTSDVKALLNDGYVQKEDGVVVNKLYTVTVDENKNYSVVLNATPADIKELINKNSLVGLAADIVASLAINNYNLASFGIEGKKIIDVDLTDVMALYAKDGKLNTAIDTGLSWISVSDLADLVNIIIEDLTDFAALETALQTDGKVASYTVQTAPWNFEVTHVAEGDYLSVNLGANKEKTESSLSIYVTGALQDELALLAGALADTVFIDVEADMDDVVRNENNVINVSGSFKGVIEVDFTQDPNYVIAMAVLLADNADAKLKAQLVEAIEFFYSDVSLYKLEKVFKSVSIKQICDSLGKHTRNESFAQIVNGLNLSASTKNAIVSAIDNTEMGYRDVVDVFGFALRQLQARGLLETITENGRVLGGIEKHDEKGQYFGFSADKHFIREFGPVRGYSLLADLDVTEVSVKLRLFLDHVHTFEENPEEQYLKTPANCTEAAVYYKSCSVCGEAHATETFVYGEPLGHDMIEVVDEKYLKTPANCTDAAVYYKSCSVCGEASEETFTYGEALGHKLVQVVDEKYLAAPANCEYAAMYYYSCEVCGEASDRTFVYGEPLGHDWIEVVDEKYLVSEATCTELAVYYKSCSVCGEASEETFTYGELAEHKWSEVVDEKYLAAAADCTNAAKYYYSCSVCGEPSEETFTYGEPLGHDWIEVVDEKYLAAAADCTNAAKYYYSCSVCGEPSEETFTYGEPLGHDWVEVVADKYLVSAADYHNAAVYRKSCSVCGEPHPTETFTYGEPLACPAPEITDVAGKIDGVNLFGWKTDVIESKNILFLDVKAEGITKAELEAMLNISMNNDADNKAKLSVEGSVKYNDKNLIPTGAKVTVEAENAAGVKATTEYIIVIMGDANGNGMIDAGDAVKMTNHFFETTLLTSYKLMAADVNQDGNIDAGDIRKNQIKYLNGTEGAIQYVSALENK